MAVNGVKIYCLHNFENISKISFSYSCLGQKVTNFNMKSSNISILVQQAITKKVQRGLFFARNKLTLGAGGIDQRILHGGGRGSKNVFYPTSKTELTRNTKFCMQVGVYQIFL